MQAIATFIRALIPLLDQLATDLENDPSVARISVEATRGSSTPGPATTRPTCLHCRKRAFDDFTPRCVFHTTAQERRERGLPSQIPAGNNQELYAANRRTQ